MIRFIFIICSLFVMSMSVFGQDNLSKELNKSFRKYDLVKLDNRVVIEKAKSEQPIEIQAYGRYFEFVLTPNDLRAKNYKAVETTDSGELELQRSEIITYKGKLTNNIDSEVRFTVTEENIEGFIYTGFDKFFINQARNFSESAQKNDVVVYGEEDLIRTVDLSHDIAALPDDVEGKMDFGLDIIKPYLYGDDKTDEAGESAAAAELRTIEVGTEADYQWVTQAGGASAANNEILGILNMVDGIYERDLNLSISVTFQHAWSTADPYAAGSTIALLDSFLAYWNINYPKSQAQYARDIAHLFTGKFSNQGIAYQGIVCRNSTVSYGLTARSGNVNHLIAAHEIGHNLNAEHVENSGSCASSIMIPVLSGNVTAFCETSKSQIQNYVAANGSCLTTGGTNPTPTPTPTPTPVTCIYSITNTNQSFGSTGGTGSVSVIAPNGCSWNAFSNSSFITITSGATGSGNGTVTYSVAANNGAARTGTITIAGQIFTVNQSAAAAPSYEADVASRPNGNGSILSDDIVQIRKFLNGTDTPNQSTDEFQRADSAPFATKGDGRIFSDDVVQARRYQNGVSPKQTAGGPMTAIVGQAFVDQLFAGMAKTVAAGLAKPVDEQASAFSGAQHELRVESATASSGQTVTVNLRVDAQGDGSEYGFSLNYQPGVLSNPVVGAGSAGASIRSCNTSVSGQINCSVGGFSTNNPASSDAGIGEISAGTNQVLITVTFTIAANAPTGDTWLTLSQVNASNDAAQLFSPTATNGVVTIPAPRRRQAR